MSARLSRPISVRRLGEKEDVHVEATPEERAAIADALDLLALSSLEASITLRPWRGQGVRVTGTVEGSATQACVVSLEPVPCVVRETLEVFFHPEADPRANVVDIDPDAPDPPEPLEGQTVDVGAIVLEHFALGLPPYPRADGAEFAPLEEDEGEPSPFAVLASLKNNSN